MNDEQCEFLGKKLDRIAEAIHCLIDAIEEIPFSSIEISNERLDKMVDNIEAVYGFKYQPEEGIEDAIK